jgi:glucans biosynthesis protein
MEPPSKGDWQKLEPWTTFLGASYFRAIGELGQVGLSARGIALSPGGGGPEEFPDFVGFWFEKSAPGSDQQTVYALLDSPSIAGAYRFLLKRTGGTIMDIDARLFLRSSVDRLGIAPLTAMYWFSEKSKGTRVDWRPEVHDSDGLGLYTGAGERIWRPLNNPTRIVVSSFFDDNPRGFGLLQRDREFKNYLDGVRYEDRPSLWVEPLGGGWGRGAVQLVEIPTDDEIHDNIVAMWVPEKAPQKGDALAYSYRLSWLDDEPGEKSLGRVVATRIGRAGGAKPPRPAGRKFVIDFKGSALDALSAGTAVEAVVTTTGGRIADVTVERGPASAPGVWRARFDLVGAQGGVPVEMRCFLRSGAETLTETWLYQYEPGVAS